MIVAVGMTAANAPEASGTDQGAADLAHQAFHLAERRLDRADLASTLVRERPADLQILCKAGPVQSGPAGQFPKTAFPLDGDAGTLRCPNGVPVPFRPAASVPFPAEHCAACPLRARCPSSAHGRGVTIHPDERLLQERRERQQTPAGRAKVRDRDALAHLGPSRPLARPPRPLRRAAQEPLRPAPHRRGPDPPPRHAPRSGPRSAGGMSSAPVF